jgi:hypothetical protein
MFRSGKRDAHSRLLIILSKKTVLGAHVEFSSMCVTVVL